MRMTDSDIVPGRFVSFGATPPPRISEADLKSALLREQYRSLTRLGPYVHGVILLSTLALCAGASPGSIYDGTVLPAALLVLSTFRLVSWVKARADVDRAGLDAIRREIIGASLLGPALAFALAILASVSTAQSNIVEFALAQVAVWIAVAACSFCLSALGNVPGIVVAAATTPLIVSFLIRGSDLTTWLAALLTIGAGFVIRMLGENFRMFAEIVRSRLALAEKQRAAENARQAAMTIALTDDLTGLPNRRSFQSRLAERIRTGAEPASPFAVGLIDLDGFKPINDIHGHPFGDDILRQVAGRLARAMEGRGSAARMGGDEFAILCDAISDRAEAIALGDEIRAIFATPFAVQGLTIALTGAFGFALFPSSAAEPEGLVRLADAALYRAKAIGRGGAAVHSASAEDAAGDRFTLEDALRRAVAESKIGVVFQPIVELRTGRISGFESLARWDDAALGPIAPSVFIPIAEQIGVIDELSRDLLRKAAKTAAEWPADVSLSFSLTAAQLSAPTTCLCVISALSEFGLPPARLEVEVREAAIMKNIGAARDTIEALRTAGVRVALDDFRAGPSGLGQLRDLALDRIKIDRSFIDRICSDPEIASLTRAILDMGQRLGLPCVAKGIERQDQLDELRLIGCASGQGTLFASAMPAAMVTEWIERQRCRAAA
jgi:diguanylate cyclase (GGDEF)-like protein